MTTSNAKFRTFPKEVKIMLSLQGLKNVLFTILPIFEITLGLAYWRLCSQCGFHDLPMCLIGTGIISLMPKLKNVLFLTIVQSGIPGGRHTAEVVMEIFSKAWCFIAALWVCWIIVNVL